MRRAVISVFALCVLLPASPLSRRAALAQGQAVVPEVIPTPQLKSWDKEHPPSRMELKLVRTFVISKGAQAVVAGVEQCRARLKELGLPDIPLRDGGSEPGEPGTVWIGVQPHVLAEGKFAGLPEPEAQGYRLLVGEDWAVILGKDVPGAFYGLMTLRQLIGKDGCLARVRVSDWPDLPLRGTYGIGGDPRVRIPYFASLKLNMVLLESGEFYRLDDPDVRKRYEELSALCSRHFIDLVPELQSLGWGQFVLEHVPEAVEGVYVENKRCSARDGQILPPEDDIVVPPDVELKDPGFETAEGDKLTGWGQDEVGGGTRLDAEAKHAGNSSLRFSRQETGTPRVWQDIACLPNRAYTLRCWLKVQDVKGQGAYIEAYGLDAPDKLGKFFGGARGVTGTRDWFCQEKVVQTGEYTRVRVYVRLQESVGTAWFDDVEVLGAEKRHPFGNVILTETAKLVVKDAAGKTVYEEGKDYTVAPGDVLKGTPPRYPSDVKPMEIRLLPGSRIKEKQEVLVSYNYAPPGSITCCPSEPRYQQFMRKSIQSVIRCLKPRHIHIGHDEPRVLLRDSRCLERGLSKPELFAADIKLMREYAREVDPKVRLMMWADAVNPYHNAPHLGMKDPAALLPRDVIICAWWYSFPDTGGRLRKSIDYFSKHGFDVTGSPWFNQYNAHEWAVELVRGRRSSKHVLGEIYTSWGHPSADPWLALTTMAEYSWTHKKPGLANFIDGKAE